MVSSARDRLKGKAKEVTGKLTGNERMRIDGEATQAKARAREAVAKKEERAQAARDAYRDFRNDDR
ncbi:CsbD family protein [Streptomyces sp. SID5785]|uniref:CsbD family protein n=1 Tax=Streptomyces sp. SID5785 TaxID=2690309 RepID=UPI0013617813|nr:CsbD family protein [Streptomyces sp. SID5785]MZD09856.1 CsbD family protein [Streptomyces sp. SID5785]